VDEDKGSGRKGGKGMALIYQTRWEFLEAAKGKSSADPGSLFDIYETMVFWEGAGPRNKGIFLYAMYRACKAFLKSFQPVLISPMQMQIFGGLAVEISPKI
jgi:hypothetical protein